MGRPKLLLPAIDRGGVHRLQCLVQMSQGPTLSIDSGDLKVIEEYAKTGYITDATTNPLFVSQAGLSGDPIYAGVGATLLLVNSVRLIQCSNTSFSVQIKI